jgi:MFS transporter, AAHS family, 4-hydroxybenzoate transporter
VQDWLPILVHAAGLTIRQAVLIGTLFQVGGIIAAPLVGLFMDRFGSYKVLLSLYGAGALLVVATGQIGTDAATLMAMSFCIGICIVGGQIATFTHTARFYPTAMRSTGIGWSMGIGRIGGIVGPLIAGVLISLQWGHALLFFVGGLPLAFATLAIFVMAKAYQGAASRNAGGETSLTGTAAAAKQPQA